MKKKILLIEDNREIRKGLAEVLEMSNYQVIVAENGKEGVLKAAQEQPDLIICDVMMPELDGFGVINVLEKKPETADIPFIFLTAKTDFRKGMSLGADDYITKPFQTLELLEAVERRLKKNERLKTAFGNSPKSLRTIFDEATPQRSTKNLLPEKQIRRFKKQETIYREFEYPNYLYFVVSGKVKTFKTHSTGKNLIINILKPGDYFGYNYLIQKTAYTESAVALEEAEVKQIHKDDFLGLLYNNRDFSAQFIKIMAVEILQKEDQLLNYAYDSIRKRASQALLNLHHNFSSPKNPSFTITRNDLANMIGSAKESVSRILTDLKEEGLIDLKGNDITILNLQKLENVPF